MKLFKDSIWSFAGEFSLRISKFILIILIARYFDKGSVGAFNYGLSYAAIFTFFFDFGLMQVAVREAYKDKKIALAYYSAIKLMATIIGFGVILTVISVTNLNENLKYFVILASIYIIFNDFSIFVCSKYRYELNFKKEALLRLIMGVLQFIIPIIFIVIFHKINYVYYGLIIASFITLFPLLCQIKKEKIKFDFSCVKISEKDKEIFKSSLLIASQGLLFSLLFNLDLVILGYFKSLEDVGSYSIISKIIFGIVILPIQIIQIPMYSRMSKAVNSLNKNDLSNYWNALYKITSLIGILICAAAILAHSYIFYLFRIDENMEVNLIFSTYIVAAQVIYLYIPINQFLTVSNREFNAFYALIPGVILLALLSIGILNLFNYQYLALSVLISEILILYIYKHLINELGENFISKKTFLFINSTIVVVALIAFINTYMGSVLSIVVIMLLMILFWKSVLNLLTHSYTIASSHG